MKFARRNIMRSYPMVFALICVFSAGTMLTSCDDEENTDQIILQSFGPSGVHHGDKIRFIGVNLDKVTAVVLPPGIDIGKSQFAVHSSEVIEITVPLEAEAGKVILKTPQGDIESKSMLSFEVPVEITSITAEAKPGTNITIAGSFVNWIEEITFNDGVVVTEFVSKSTSELVVKVPMDAQTGFLLFASGGTEPLSFASEEELVVTMPAITSVGPTTLKHTEDLTITGTDLDLITSIVFSGNQTATEFVSQSESEIVVSVPVGTIKGSITLKQASPIDIVPEEELTIILPTGTALTPRPATPGTDDITITGTNLDLIASLVLPAITDAIPASAFVSHSPTEIVLAVPDGAKSGGLVYNTIHGYSNNLGVTLVVPGDGPPPLPVTLYDETIAGGGGDWGWNIVMSDPASVEQFYSGDVSWKFETDNGGGLSGGGIAPVDASGQTYFSFSLYGGPGTDGLNVACILNDNWNFYQAVSLVEGQWTEYQIPVENYDPADVPSVVRFTFKVEGVSSSVIYADRVGFE